MATAEDRLARARDIGLLVDPEDEWMLSTFMWHVDERGYAKGRCFGKVCRIQSLIMGFLIYQDDVIDHINQNKLDNRRSNLWIVSSSENQLNTHKTENVTHIYSYEGRGHMVIIQRGGRTIFNTTYQTIEEATRARDEVLCRLSQEHNKD